MGKRCKAIHCACVAVALMALICGGCEKQQANIFWKKIAGATNHNLYGIRLDGDGKIFVAGGKIDAGVMYSSNDGGYTFMPIGNVHYHCYFDVVDNIATGGKFISAANLEFVHADEHMNITSINIPPEYLRPKTGYLSDMRSVAMSSSGKVFVAGGEKFLHGVIYTLDTLGLPQSLYYTEHEMRKVLFAKPAHGVALGYGAIYYTGDEGTNWTKATAPNDFYTDGIVLHQRLLACTYNGAVVQSLDNGHSWQTINKPNKTFANSYHYQCMAMNSSATKIIAAGTKGSAIYSTDGGATWVEGIAFDGAFINDIVFINDDIALAVGDNGTIFRFTF